MQALKNDPIWIKAVTARKFQTIFGYFSGICFTIALFALLDGLYAQMKSGPNELIILPGESVTLSGPAALKNPLASDLKAIFSPPNAPLTFELEGFFTGYWFGSGMWRGKVIANKDATNGKYELKIHFKGTSAQNVQKYFLTIFSTNQEMHKSSFSILKRIFYLNPFILAFCAGITAIGLGIITFIFGRNYTINLRNLGLTQILTTKNRDIWCLMPKNLCPQPGMPRMILDEHGNLVTEARTNEWHKGKLHLTILEDRNISPNYLVCLRHPGSRLQNYKVEREHIIKKSNQ